MTGQDDECQRRPVHPLLTVRSVERNLAVIHEIDESVTHLDLTLQPGVTLIAKVVDTTGQTCDQCHGMGGYDERLHQLWRGGSQTLPIRCPRPH